MLYAIIAVIVLILDQWLKYWVTLNITLSTGEQPLIGGVIKLVNVHNDGAAFSAFSNMPYMKWVFIGLTVLLAVAVAVLLAKKVFKGPFATTCLVLILAGAVGNCIDRLVYGYVVDMFKLEFVNFAVFNVADAVLVVASLLFIIYLFVGDKDDGKKAPAKGKKSKAKKQSDGEKPHAKKRSENKSDAPELSYGIDSRSVDTGNGSSPIKTEEQDPFWDSFKASLREEEKPAEAKTPEAPKLDLAAVKEAARPAKSEAPEFRMPPKEESEEFSLEDILSEFK